MNLPRADRNVLLILRGVIAATDLPRSRGREITNLDISCRMHLDGFVCKLYHRTNSRTGCSAAFPNSLLGCLGRRQFVFPCEIPHSDRVTASDMPYTCRFCNYRKYLPRACGDVPNLLSITCKGIQFTPRLRGCTQERRASDFAAAIYPAPAGMYLVHFSLRVLKGNLPRACGGVPYFPNTCLSRCCFTPRLRGCTLRYR